MPTGTARADGACHPGAHSPWTSWSNLPPEVMSELHAVCPSTAPRPVPAAPNPPGAAAETLRAHKRPKPRWTPPDLEHPFLSSLRLHQRHRGPRLPPGACPLLRAAPRPPGPMQTHRRQPPAASPCTAAGGKSLHRAGDSSGHPHVAGPPRTPGAAVQMHAWPARVPASMQRRAEAACSSLRSPAPGLPLPCLPGAATNLRRSRRSRWSRFPRGCWSCRHRAPSPRAPRP